MFGHAAPPAEDVDTVGDRANVVRLCTVVPPNCAAVFVKVVDRTSTESYKDRLAKYIIEEAERRGDLKPGMTIVAATDGSTGFSLAFACILKKYPLTIVSSNAFDVEKLRSLEGHGALKLDLVYSSSGITPDLIPSMVHRAKELAQGDGYYLADQFHNEDTCIEYETMGRELLNRFPEGIDAFCGAVGGAGIAMGIAKILKSKWPEIFIAMPEPASSPTIRESRPGAHSVEGIGFYPPHPDWKLCNEVCAVPEEEGHDMYRRLVKEECLSVEAPTGFNVAAAIALAKRLGPGKQVVTVAVQYGVKNTSSNWFT
ncbi:cysteine synthase A [Aspergillus pseudotamarii]|uniref:Cysteine synthase A n=1 Tax=Aspergillus pseudotamarii TaxID=132259 RepID=A0A5N6SVR3_ASPPS|nr:cysteine synthase A [Aspergillus pseudotamarii]KAE8137830.1 cysteine synthase A [Aspergillus pseudotamarii]